MITEQLMTLQLISTECADGQQYIQCDSETEFIIYNELIVIKKQANPWAESEITRVAITVFRELNWFDFFFAVVRLASVGGKLGEPVKKCA